MRLYDYMGFHVPRGIKVLYLWLLSRGKPGEIQEFDKEDFDNFCRSVGRKKSYSVRWFSICVKKLEESPLLTIIRRYRGHGYQVKVYAPKDYRDLEKLIEPSTYKSIEKSEKEREM